MLPVSTVFAIYDQSVAYWLAVPSISSDGTYTISVTALVWQSCPAATRARMRRALKSALSTDNIRRHIMLACTAEEMSRIKRIGRRIRIVTYGGGL